MATATVFSEDPVAMARHWAAQGAKRLHVVDLNGAVAVEGWSKLTGHDVVDLAKKFEEYGVEALIYTDIGRDGMMNGVNIEATLKLAQAIKTPIIASGGLNGVQDIQTICEKLAPE